MKVPDWIVLPTMSEPAEPPLPRRLAAMHRRWGVTAGKTCGGCAHLACYEYNHTYYKCLVYGDTNSAASDWRLKWPACGRWEAQP